MVSRLYKLVKDDRFWSVSYSRRRCNKPVFTGFPYSCTWYGYRTVAADLYLQAFPGGYPGIELLNLLGGIIASQEPQRGQCSTASKFGFSWNFAHDENELHHSFTLFEPFAGSGCKITKKIQVECMLKVAVLSEFAGRVDLLVLQLYDTRSIRLERIERRYFGTKFST